jgi:large subunit ribosomal protein L21
MSIYAVIQTGGKQYRVQPGDVVQIEKLEGDVGTAVKFDQILFASKANGDASQIWLGKPLLSGATVQGEIVGQGRGDKILIIKMKRRKQYRKTQGHRQYLTQVLVTGVDNGAGEKATLSDSDKKERLSKFQSHLRAKGSAFSPKILGSRKRLAQAASGGKQAASGEKAAPPKAEKKTAAKPAAKKPAAKK